MPNKIQSHQPISWLNSESTDGLHYGPRRQKTNRSKSIAGLLLGSVLSPKAIHRQSSHGSCASANPSIKDQLGMKGGSGQNPIARDLVLDSLSRSTGRLALDVSSAIKLFRKHAGPTQDWGLAPCGYWIAIHSRFNTPQEQFKYGDPVRKTLAELTSTFKAHQPDLLAFPAGPKAALREWLLGNRLEVVPVPSLERQGGVVMNLIKDAFADDGRGYRIITLHSSEAAAVRGIEQVHTIAVWSGSHALNASFSLFDPAYGEFEFAKADALLEWFQQDFWPRSAYSERFQGAPEVSRVLAPGNRPSAG